MPNEDSLRHKYAPLPEEPRFKKKRKKVHIRIDHKHEYEEVCVEHNLASDTGSCISSSAARCAVASATAA